MASHGHYVKKISNDYSKGQMAVLAKSSSVRLTLEAFGDFKGAVYAFSILCVTTLLFLIFAEERNFLTMQQSILKFFLELYSLSFVYHSSFFNRYFTRC